MIDSMLFVILYFAIIIAIVYFIYSRVNIFISLKREHNDLLREILKKMDKEG